MAAGENPRQRMINVMYIVLTAMLALNVSSEVLEGFTLVQEGLQRNKESITNQNKALFSELEYFHQVNPEKSQIWYDRGLKIKSSTDSLIAYVENIKLRIVQQADGPDGDINNIKRRDDLDAASIVLLKGEMEGAKLKAAINRHKALLLSLSSDSGFQESVKANFKTEDKMVDNIPKPWENSLFDKMPVAAVITLLTKLQTDLLSANSNLTQLLVKNIDVGDFRVNSIKAYVIPQSKNIIRGGKYSANIVLSAEDSTQRNRIFINNRELISNNGLFEAAANSVGEFTFNGYIQMQRKDGSTVQHPFSDKYTVTEPMATVSAGLMNVFYAGIDNPVSISVPGVPQKSVSATMTNGTLSRNGSGWIAKPSKIGVEAVISVTAELEGKRQNIASSSFKVRPLPNPSAFIIFTDVNGNPSRYTGGIPFNKSQLLSSTGVGAAIDDGILNTPFTVLSFETDFTDSMGNSLIDKSDGNQFSAKQKAKFRRSGKGNRFYINSIIARGPDGIERKLSGSIRVIVN